MASRQFIRSLATSAAAAVKPPVQLFGLDGTYATALFTASAKESSIDKTFNSVEKLNTAIKQDSKLAAILANPALSADSRKQVISTVSSTLKLEPIVSNLLTVLSENNRLELFPAIAKQFNVLNSAHNGIVEATVVSAKPLDSKTLQRLQKAIEGSKFVGSGKTLKIANEVKPEILGGLIVEVGDKSVDLSVSAKVGKLNKVLTEAI
jgi:F-type H+-transporting ATPase subunit O